MVLSDQLLPEPIHKHLCDTSFYGNSFFTSLHAFQPSKSHLHMPIWPKLCDYVKYMETGTYSLVCFPSIS